MRIASRGILAVASLSAGMVIGNGPAAARQRLATEPRGAAARLVEPLHVIGVVEKVAMCGGLRRTLVVAATERPDPGKPVAHVEGIGNLALLAVADTVDP